MCFPNNIMIVEDEMMTQRYLKDILSQHDVGVAGCFDNGLDAIAALELHECDMVLMDINLKGALDGLRTTKRILDKHDIPIVFITAYSDQETLSEVLEYSPYGFIAKPFSPEELETAIKIAYKRFLIQHVSDKKEEENTINSDIKINNHFVYSSSQLALFCDGKLAKLSARQNELMAILCKNINTAVSSKAIVAEIWKDEHVTDSSLRTLVYSVRKIYPDLPLISHSKQGYSITPTLQ